MKAYKIAVAGTGARAAEYIENIKRLYAPLETVCLYSPDEEEGAEFAARAGINVFLTDRSGLLTCGTDILLNVLPEDERSDLSYFCLKNGLNVYSEGPPAPDLDKAWALVDISKARDATFCCGPDAFLGGAERSCLHYINDGVIGDVTGGEGYISPGREIYFITTLTNLIAPVSKVGYADIGGAKAAVAHLGDNDVSVTLLPAQDEKDNYLKITGTEGTITVPDPMRFGGRILYDGGDGEHELPSLFGWGGKCLGLGLFDMAKALDSGSSPCCDCSRALHVLEVTQALADAAATGTVTEIQSTFDGSLYLSDQLR